MVADFLVRRLDGMVEYEKLLGAKPVGLLVESNKGEKLLAWRELSPYTMIELHKRIPITHLSDAEKQQRREQLVAYMWLTGLESKALIGAETLAHGNPGFSERWKTCMESIN